MDDISLNIIKSSAQTYSQKLSQIFNYCVSTANFPGILKYADVTQVFIKGDVTDKKNYRTISTLTNYSKIFEKLIYNQIFEFINPKLSTYIPEFRKNSNTLHTLLKPGDHETWKPGNKIGAFNN